MVVSLLFSLHDFIRDWLVIPVRLSPLPRLAFYEILQSMNHMDLVRLGLTSEKMETLIKDARIKLPLYRIVVRCQYSNIEICYNKKYIFCGEEEFETEDAIRKYQLSKWCKNECPVKNLSKVHQKLQYLFKCNKITLCFQWTENTRANIQNSDFLMNLLKMSESLLVYGGKINSDDLSFILKNVHTNQPFELRRIEVPEDFDAENVFGFTLATYSDARWVKTKHFEKIRNFSNVTLEKNKLKSSDFNTIIKYWINCESEMWSQIDIDLNEDIDTEKLFNGLTVLCINYTPGEYYYILSKSKSKRKGMLAITFTSEILFMIAMARDEKICLWKDEPERTDFENEYDILNMLKKKNELENVKTVDEEVEEKLRKLNIQLEERQVRFENGMATIG